MCRTRCARHNHRMTGCMYTRDQSSTRKSCVYLQGRYMQPTPSRSLAFAVPSLIPRNSQDVKKTQRERKRERERERLPHNLAATFFFPNTSFLYLSLNSRLKILPEGDFGMTSVNSTPPLSHLWRDLLRSMNCWILRRTTASESSRPVEEGSLTTHASGSSPAESSGTGMTAQSATAGCSRRAASSSAGATWRPC